MRLSCLFWEQIGRPFDEFGNLEGGWRAILNESDQFWIVFQSASTIFAQFRLNESVSDRPMDGRRDCRTTFS